MSTKSQAGKTIEKQAVKLPVRQPAAPEAEAPAQEALAAAAYDHAAAPGAPPLDPREVRALQQTAGNLAVQRLLSNQGGPTIQRDVPLTRRRLTGAEADTEVRRRFDFILGRFVEGGGRMPSAAGRIHVVDDATFVREYEREYATEEDRRGHPVEGLNAFVGFDGQAWVHEERGTVGTVIHESLHMYSNSELLEQHMGRQGKEGMTEYFTVQVMRQMGLSRRYEEYVPAAEAVEALVNFAGEIWVQNAYFRGRVTALSHHVDDLFGHHRAFLLWCRAMKNDRFSAAQEMFLPENRRQTIRYIEAIRD
jgi:hypothetical protein